MTDIQSLPYNSNTSSQNLITEKQQNPIFSIYQEMASECFGVFILCTFGMAGIAQQMLTSGNSALQIDLGFSLGLFFALQVSMKVSGQLNPAVTFALYWHGKIPFKKVIPFFLAQTLGAFLASIVVFWNYNSLIFQKDPELLFTRSIFTTFPANKNISHANLMLDHIIATSILSFAVFMLTDPKRNFYNDITKSMILGLILFLIINCFGANSGASLNPARDFGPRFFCLIAGYGESVFSDYNYYFYSPIIGTLLGGVLGGYLFKGQDFVFDHRKNERDFCF